MIPKEEIEKAVIEAAKQRDYYPTVAGRTTAIEYNAFRSGFKACIPFAEAKMKEMMKEFAQWCEMEYELTEIGWIDSCELFHAESKVYTTDQLIQKFLEERK